MGVIGGFIFSLTFLEGAYIFPLLGEGASIRQYVVICMLEVSDGATSEQLKMW